MYRVRVIFRYNNNKNNNTPMTQQLIKDQGCKPTVGLIFDCLQTEEKDHLASFGVACGQRVGSPNRCWISRPGLPLQISSYQNSSERCVGIGPI